MQLIIFILNFLGVWLRLLRPGGVKLVAAENLVLRNQLMVLTRHQKRSPKLNTVDRVFFGFLGSMLSPKRLARIAIAVKPATLLKFHKALVTKKYHLLFSNKNARKPGRKGPDEKLTHAILEMKRRNPAYGYRRIAMQISKCIWL